MNKKLRVLTLALLKNSFSFPADPRKKARQIVIFALLGLSLVPMFFNIVRFLANMYDALVLVGEAGVLLSLGTAISAFVIFFFGLFYVMNTFYFSDEIEVLLPLPLKFSQILGAKFIIVTIFEYLTEGLILLPILIVYGIKSGQGFLYYLYALLVFLALPVLPIMLDSVIVMLIMRFTNLGKNKDTFRMVSAIIAIFLGVGMNVLIRRFALNQELDRMQLGNNSLVALTSNIFPVAKFGALGLINSGRLSGLGYTCLFLVISILGFYLFLILSNLLYYKGVTGVSVSSSRQRKISDKELSRQTVRSSVLKSYILKELRILFRTPSYFVNCILMNFLWPVLIIMPSFAQPKGMGRLGVLNGLLSNEGILGSLLAAAFGVMLLVSSSNGIAATSISREGENILFNKYIPVSYKTQILAKVISGVLMGLAGLLSLGIAAAAVLKISLVLLALICGTSLLAILFSNLSGVMLDLFNPKLHWDNEQKAVKQNINLLLSMAWCLVFGGLTAFAAFRLELNVTQTAISLVVVYGLLDVLLYLSLMKKGSELFSKIED